MKSPKMKRSFNKKKGGEAIPAKGTIEKERVRSLEESENGGQKDRIMKT